MITLPTSGRQAATAAEAVSAGEIAATSDAPAGQSEFSTLLDSHLAPAGRSSVADSALREPPSAAAAAARRPEILTGHAAQPAAERAVADSAAVPLLAAGAAAESPITAAPASALPLTGSRAGDLHARPTAARQSELPGRFPPDAAEPAVSADERLTAVMPSAIVPVAVTPARPATAASSVPRGATASVDARSVRHSHSPIAATAPERAAAPLRVASAGHPPAASAAALNPLQNNDAITPAPINVEQAADSTHLTANPQNPLRDVNVAVPPAAVKAALPGDVSNADAAPAQPARPVTLTAAIMLTAADAIPTDAAIALPGAPVLPPDAGVQRATPAPRPLTLADEDAIAAATVALAGVLPTASPLEGRVATSADAPAPAVASPLSARDRLDALLTGQLKPAGLSAPLSPLPSAVRAALGDTDAVKPGALPDADALNEQDRQTLEALNAMLSGSMMLRAAPESARQPARLQDETAASFSLRSGPTLNDPRALSNAGAASVHEEKTSPGQAVTGFAATGTAASQPQSAALASAPAPVTASVTKDIDKENSSYATSATITSHALSAALPPMTPLATAAAASPAASQLNSQLGSPEWQQALGQQILMFSRNGQQSAELHLHPQDLGSIQISLKLDNDQAQLNMVSGHSQVRAALEAALPQLRIALAENGISLGQSNVSSDAFQQGQSFAGQQEQQRNNSGSSFSPATENDSEVTPLAVPAALQARAAGTGAVDIFA